MGGAVGNRFYRMAVGPEMVVSLVLVIAGVAAVAGGLGGQSPWMALAAPVGWLAFLAGTVTLLVPGFF